MSATVARPRAAAPARARATARADVLVASALAALFAVVAALTWRRWGVPEIDAGAELTTADLVARGAVAYQDVRYFYGPLGLYGLALAFKVLGTSFTTAYAFGLVQAAAILAVFHVLARQWLRPLAAGLATAVLLAIGFSGTAFNFVLPHTNSATFGLLFLLLMLLALARDRLLLAGTAAGLVGLTRPEFAAVAAGAGLAFLAGTWFERGRTAVPGAAWRLALPAIAIPVVVLGFFAERAGASRLLTENLWPVDFIRVAGFRTQSDWMPADAAAVAGLVARGAIYAGLLAALVATVAGAQRRRGAGRILAAWPLAAAVAALVLAAAAARATGVAATQRTAIEDEATHLLLGMSVLPALGLVAAAYAVVRLVRRGAPPLGGSWAADLALIAAGAALGVRAYNAFTTEGSYAPYYAAPLVLLLAILHERLGDRVPAARPALMAVLAVIAAGLAGYALHGLYADATTAVRTPRGTFMTTARAAPALQAAVDEVVAGTRSGERILAAPSDGGLYFMTGRRPALYELMLLPGLLDSRADERRAIADLRRARVRLAVLGARDFSTYGFRTFGVDYDPLLGAYLRRRTVRAVEVGTQARPAAGTNPSAGFTIRSMVP